MSDEDAATRERLTRWRLVLGSGEADGVRSGGEQLALSDGDTARDKVLGQLYDGDRRGGLSGSQPRVARWLGDIRDYFPSSVVQVMQADAIERLGPDPAAAGTGDARGGRSRTCTWSVPCCRTRPVMPEQTQATPPASWSARSPTSWRSACAPRRRRRRSPAR